MVKTKKSIRLSLSRHLHDMPREWNTPKREAWNAPIHNILKAIDEHNRQYFIDRDPWHLEKANQLRQYLHELKTWIHRRERRDS